jgi:hypothetical protein
VVIIQPCYPIRKYRSNRLYQSRLEKKTIMPGISNGAKRITGKPILITAGTGRLPEASWVRTRGKTREGNLLNSFHPVFL